MKHWKGGHKLNCKKPSPSTASPALSDRDKGKESTGKEGLLQGVDGSEEDAKKTYSAHGVRVTTVCYPETLERDEAFKQRPVGEQEKLGEGSLRMKRRS